MIKIIEEKNQIRKKIRELHLTHDNIYKENASKIIMNKVENHVYFKHAKNILLYWSAENEVNTHEFIIKWYLKKNIYLPCIKNERELEFRLFEGIEKLKINNKFNIPEPIGKIFSDAEEVHLAIIPGLAFDLNKNRMGRGKGYYDNYLKNKKFWKIGICFDYQIFDKIPTDENDVKMDEIISEKQYIK